MLIDAARRNLRLRSKTYKVTDRDGMYVVVTTSRTIAFRYDYRMHGRRKTLTIRRYGRAGIGGRAEECGPALWLAQLPGGRHARRPSNPRTRP
jgi:hypothetical protein